MIRHFARFSKNYAKNFKQYTEPLVEGEHKVLKAFDVPEHIPKPGYITKQEPFGIYEGEPVKHGPEKINKLRKAGQIARDAMVHAAQFVKEGNTGEDVDKAIHDYIISQGAYPTPIGFMGFPKSICVSINETLCHGIPSTRKFKNGDYVNLDCTIYYDGVHGDNSMMVMVGDVHEDIQKLIKVTQGALYEGIKVCKPGVPFKNIGKVIQEYTSDHGYVVCDLFNGHGIGELLHMPPMVLPTYNSTPYNMEPGNAFTIEPILMMHASDQYYMWNDNFTILSPNNPSAQFEHTVSITETGREIFTKRDGELID